LVHSIKQVQRSVLVRGTDYGVIPGTGRSPVLLKPGAERLLQVFGLGHHMDVLTYDEDGDGQRRGVTYRCTVTKVLADGREIVVSSCDGHASMDEPKWRKAPWNTIIKMAQKRALVGATLTATATSGLFTQDMEDYYDEHPMERQPAQEYSAPTNPDAPITAGQTKKLMALFNSLGIKDRADRLAEVKRLIDREVESSKDLTMGEAHLVIEALEAREGGS
jgi:hypothetical protein